MHVHGEDVTVATTSIQPIGLILNELVTNAAKHGAGRIDVTLNANPGGGEIVVCDEGEGLPAGFHPDHSTKSLGMKVVSALASQLGGGLTAGANPHGSGACFKVSFAAYRLRGDCRRQGGVTYRSLSARS